METYSKNSYNQLMKFEAKFVLNDGAIFDLDGKKFELSSQKYDGEKFGEIENISDSSAIHIIEVSVSRVGLDEDSYNESFLAALRDSLKILEEKNVYVLVKPLSNKETLSEIEKEAFTASFKHCMRRIKDCESVIGMIVPSCVDRDYFVGEIQPKHAHYIFM